jgi:hypothetical protein
MSAGRRDPCIFAGCLFESEENKVGHGSENKSVAYLDLVELN